MKHLFHADKKGRGIYRRFFHHLPSHGAGAVDYRKRLSCFAMEGSRAMHQIRDTGVECKVLVRDRSCHGCDKCWVGDWDHCDHIELVGPTDHVTLNPPSQIVQRILRSHAALKAHGQKLCTDAGKTLIGKFVAVELAWADARTDAEPYCIVRVDSVVKKHKEGTTKCTGQDDKTWMGALRRNDLFFMATKLEPISHGSSIYAITKKEFWVFPDDVRVIDVKLTELATTNTRGKSAAQKLSLAIESKREILSNLSIDQLEERIN